MAPPLKREIEVPVEHYEALLDDRYELSKVARVALRRGWRTGSLAEFIQLNWEPSQ